MLSRHGDRAVVAVAAMIALTWLFVSSAPAAAADPALTARGSVEQVQVTGATPGKRVKLVRRGNAVDTRRAGELGGIVFRKVEPGGGYTVREAGGPQTRSFQVLSGRAKPPSTEIYEQEIPAGGYGYMETRDGTRLSMTVHLPGPPEDGPYPTLLEYSGYGYADPAGPESGIGPVGGLLGYAVVDVNMRGTGCSGGAFDFFERLQALDGYDLIETIARQPWAKGKVGMVGISYGGISQLFVGATRPPSLAAIAPLSVLDAPQTTLYPGGLLNTGFALEWARDRVEDAMPAGPSSGQPWAWRRIQEGDEICKENQELHTEAIDLIAKTRRNEYYRPKVADPLTPREFVHRIQTPVFMACQWTDEQTGGHCPTLASRFTGTDRKWFTFLNGTHSDSLDPEIFNRWFDFLEIYVAERRPSLPPGLKALAPALYAGLMGVPGVRLPDDPIQGQPDLASAREAFEAQPPIRILFDSGAGDAPGKPVPAFEGSFRKFPPAKTEARSWFLAHNGNLRRNPRGRGADRFKWDPGARPPTNFTGNTGSGAGGLWTASPDYQWSQSAPGRALSYRTRPLRRDTAVIGAGELQVWLRSKARNVDLQATVTELRPDGKESFVQSGWLRSGARKLDRSRSSLTEPVPSFRKRDAKRLPRGRYVKLRIPLYYQGHVYRKGSRIRVTISAPGGDQPIWAFAEAKPNGTPSVRVAHNRKLRSRLVLPITPRLRAQTPLPPCPGLRGQPCRDYVPLTNRKAGGG
jgi:uncharacterized protein